MHETVSRKEPHAHRIHQRRHLVHLHAGHACVRILLRRAKACGIGDQRIPLSLGRNRRRVDQRDVHACGGGDLPCDNDRCIPKTSGRPRALVALTCTLTLAAMALVGAGLSAHSVALLSLGIFCRSIGRALTLCLFALCLVQLESEKQVSFAIALGLFIFSVLDLFRGVIGTPLNAILLLGAAQIIVAVWAMKPASRVLDITSAGDSVDDLKLADPHGVPSRLPRRFRMHSAILRSFGVRLDVQRGC